MMKYGLDQLACQTTSPSRHLVWYPKCSKYIQLGPVAGPVIQANGRLTYTVKQYIDAGEMIMPA
jgi:hypothetical protein